MTLYYKRTSLYSINFFKSQNKGGIILKISVKVFKIILKWGLTFETGLPSTAQLAVEISPCIKFLKNLKKYWG